MASEKEISSIGEDMPLVDKDYENNKTGEINEPEIFDSEPLVLEKEYDIENNKKSNNSNKDEIQKLEQEKFWDIRRFEDRRNLSDSLCDQPRFYEKRLGVYSSIILESIN